MVRRNAEENLVYTSPAPLTFPPAHPPACCQICSGSSPLQLTLHLPWDNAQLPSLLGMVSLWGGGIMPSGFSFRVFHSSLCDFILLSYVNMALNMLLLLLLLGWMPSSSLAYLRTSHLSLKTLFSVASCIRPSLNLPTPSHQTAHPTKQ